MALCAREGVYALVAATFVPVPSGEAGWRLPKGTAVAAAWLALDRGRRREVPAPA